MEIIAIILGVFSSTVFLLLVLAFFIPKQYSVEVSILINESVLNVHNYVSKLRNQVKYSEWLMADPNLQFEMVGTDGKVGAVLRWESHNEDKNKNVGVGEQEIIELSLNKMEIELRLTKPKSGVCKLTNRFVESGINQTLYTCTFYGYAKYPINLPSYLLGRRFIRRVQERSLENLKTILEN